MRFRFDKDGGFQALFGRVLSGKGPARLPQIGDIVRLEKTDSLLAPPRGKLWHQPSWAQGLFQLNDLVHHPIFEVGDVFGIHPNDPIPLPPSGTRLLRIANPSAPVGETSAALFKVVLPPAAQMVVAVPKPPLPSLQAAEHFDIPRAPGKRWQVLGVDGRNLKRQLGALVAA